MPRPPQADIEAARQLAHRRIVQSKILIEDPAVDAIAQIAAKGMIPVWELILEALTIAYGPPDS